MNCSAECEVDSWLTAMIGDVAEAEADDIHDESPAQDELDDI